MAPRRRLFLHYLLQVCQTLFEIFPVPGLVDRYLAPDLESVGVANEAMETPATSSTTIARGAINSLLIIVRRLLWNATNICKIGQSQTRARGAYLIKKVRLRWRDFPCPTATAALVFGQR